MINLKKIRKRQLFMLLTSVMLGFLIASQAKSFSDVGDIINRNSRADVFREIQILKNTNDSLNYEIKGLEEELSKVSNNQEALESVQKEIDKYRIITGRLDVSGPGISLKIQGDIKAIWLIDIVNELLSAGAEAVSVNSIRLSNKTIGFDTIPNGQIMLNSVLLNEPYTIEAIGDKQVLNEALSQVGGIIERMGSSLKDVNVELEEKDFVKMEQILLGDSE
jgi:uncharacterized protein YlxW (UPF0749 family)